MPQPGTLRGFAVVLIVLLFTVQMPAVAQEAAIPSKEHTQESADPAGPMLVDAFLLRPLGLAATVAGTAAFVLTLPFSLPTGSVEKAAKALVVRPARYTFARPLGEFKP
ncbi:MAG: hypothetical protein OXC69_08485 [Candidatus Tectomicrobia bacterium]|nr:hypothetical protein [Candidatus Tectomicrobia bacterium]